MTGLGYLSRAAELQEQARRETGGRATRKGDLIGLGLDPALSNGTFKILGATRDRFCMSARDAAHPAVTYRATEWGITRDRPCTAPAEQRARLPPAPRTLDVSDHRGEPVLTFWRLSVSPRWAA